MLSVPLFPGQNVPCSLGGKVFPVPLFPGGKNVPCSLGKVFPVSLFPGQNISYSLGKMFPLSLFPGQNVPYSLGKVFPGFVLVPRAKRSLFSRQSVPEADSNEEEEEISENLHETSERQTGKKRGP